MQMSYAPPRSPSSSRREQRWQPPSEQLGIPNGVPLYPVLRTRASRVITAPTRRPRQSARVRAASAISRKYCSLLGRCGAGVVRADVRETRRGGRLPVRCPGRCTGSPNGMPVRGRSAEPRLPEDAAPPRRDPRESRPVWPIPRARSQPWMSCSFMRMWTMVVPLARPYIGVSNVPSRNPGVRKASCMRLPAARNPAAGSSPSQSAARSSAVIGPGAALAAGEHREDDVAVGQMVEELTDVPFGARRRRRPLVGPRPRRRGAGRRRRGGRCRRPPGECHSSLYGGRDRWSSCGRPSRDRVRARAGSSAG